MKSKVLEILENEKKNLPEDVYFHISSFFDAYDKVQKEKGLDIDVVTDRLQYYLDLIKAEINSPTKFAIFHKQETSPIDFFDFALSIMRPFIDKEESKIFGKSNIDKILTLLEQGENVLLLANHQAEPDPAILGVLLEEQYPGLIRNMIAVAGSRVTTDPITVPLTRGQNVLCVYSKKYFELHAEKKKEMQQHNSASMLSLRHVLNEGGKLVYVAPSGGRDRKDKDGNLSPAMFNPESIELMRLVGAKSNRKTHYFPLAMYTYPILPPPEKIKKAIGEQRKMCHSPVHVYFGEEYKMLEPTAEEKKEKNTFRTKQASEIHKVVKTLYEEITR